MARFWPTPLAAEQMPVVAEGMNKLPKVVSSRTLDHASWSNTRLVKSDLALAAHGLIDEFQIAVIPVVLGKGRIMFEGAGKRVPLRLIRARAFANGNVLLCYEPAPRWRPAPHCRFVLVRSWPPVVLWHGLAEG